MKLSIAEDCGNAPKKLLIKDYNIAFAESDTDKILSMMSDDAVWELVGDKVYEGKAAIRTALDSMDIPPAAELRIDNIISHGDRAASNGVLSYTDSEVTFSDVYVFTSHAKDALIKRMTSYGVEL